MFSITQYKARLLSIILKGDWFLISTQLGYNAFSNPTWQGPPGFYFISWSLWVRTVLWVSKFFLSEHAMLVVLCWVGLGFFFWWCRMAADSSTRDLVWRRAIPQKEALALIVTSFEKTVKTVEKLYPGQNSSVIGCNLIRIQQRFLYNPIHPFIHASSIISLSSPPPPAPTTHPHKHAK